MLLPWLVLLSTLALVFVVGSGAPRSRPWLDSLYAGSLLCFASLSAMELLAAYSSIHPSTHRLLSMLVYQLAIFCVATLLVRLFRRGWKPLNTALSILTVLGVALAWLASSSLWPSSSPVSALQAWKGMNIGFGVVVVGLMGRVLWQRGRSWTLLILLASITALGVMVSDLVDMGNGALRVSWEQAMYGPLLTVLWLRSTRRLGNNKPSLVDFRRQLAQELHDGVGSHLSTIISGMDQSTLQGRLTVQALQECLTELKLLVDGVDEDQSVAALLASLRYRMEPLLTFAGIRMYWILADAERLEQVRGEAARHVLRITQETLANVVRHSQADEVRLTLCHMKDQDCLLLEVLDNGVGFHLGAVDNSQSDTLNLLHKPSVTPGKGLLGMRQRAERLGGELKVHTVLPQGTRIELRAPMSSLLDHSR